MIKIKNNKIHLKDIIKILENAHFKIELKFLRQLLINASKSEKPWRNKIFAKKVGCIFNKKVDSATGISGWINGYRTLPLKKLIKIVNLSDYDWVDIETKLISIKSGINKGEIYIKFPIIIEKELGAIIGYLLGDGTIDKKYSQVSFYNKDIKLLKDFHDKMYKIFNLKPRIWIQKNNKFQDKSEWLCRCSSLEEIPKNHPVALFYPSAGLY